MASTSVTCSGRTARPACGCVFGGRSRRAAERGLLFLSTPFEEAAVDLLESLGVPAYKNASYEITHLPLISYMAKTGKRLTKAYQGIDPAAAPLPVDAAVKEIKSRASAKFDETVEIAMNLNLDPRKPDQNLRGTVMLPHGTGKTVRVAVFARGDRAKEAEAAGADIVGAEDLAEKVQAGEINFDRAIATRGSAPSPRTSPRRSRR